MWKTLWPIIVHRLVLLSLGFIAARWVFAADTVNHLMAGSSTSCSSSVDGTTSDTTCLNGGKEAKTGTGYGGGANGGGLYSSIAPGSTGTARVCGW